MACLIEERVPIEVLGLILGRLLDPPEGPYHYFEHELEGFGDLRNARLVCRRWYPEASNHMFRNVALLHPELGEGREGDFSKFVQLVASPTVQKVARCAVIYSGPREKSGLRWDAWHRWEEGEYDELVTAINSIADLPGLRGVHVVFSDKCVGDPVHAHPDLWDHGAEPPWARLPLLKAVFDAVKTRALAHEGSNTTITSLTLENLQNKALPDDLLSSDAFTSVAKNITELGLQITHEDDVTGQRWHQGFPDRRNFGPWLQHTFLPIFAENLTALHISFIENWGVAPDYFNGKNLSFPQLKTLTLAKFVIGHHDQFDWVLAQKTLETLRLHHCVIVTHLAFLALLVDNQVQYLGWSVSTHDWNEQPGWAFGVHKIFKTFTFPGTWETVFNNIRINLPNLVDFRMENPPHYPLPKKFNDAGRMRRELTTMRYITFNSCLHKSPWVTAKGRSGAMHFGNNDPAVLPEAQRGLEFQNGPRPTHTLSRALETLEGDREAFNALVTTVDRRRKVRKLEEIDPRVFRVLPGNTMNYRGDWD